MNPIKSIIESMIEPVTGLISEFIEDKDKAAQLAHEISTMAANQSHAIAIAQISLNQTEAATGSLWNGGWRPFIGWTCGIALASNFVITPYFAPILMVHYGYTMPVLDMSVMMPLLLGMLGLAGMRSWDKKQGVAKE